MLMVLCYKYLIMHVHIVQSNFYVRQIPFRGDGSPHTALPHLVEPPPPPRLFVLHGGRLWREGVLSTISSPGPPLSHLTAENLTSSLGA